MKKRYIILIALALLAARQLNTVPSRISIQRGYNGHRATVQTVNTLFGSTYRGYVDGVDTGISSKYFEDVVSAVATKEAYQAWNDDCWRRDHPSTAATLWQIGFAISNFLSF
jgi:hypothetical protein